MAFFRVGGNVDGYCTRCKLVLAHTIEAIVEQTIKRVHCNTCKSKHVYRAHAPGEGEKSTAPKKVKAVGAAKPKKLGVGVAKASDFPQLMKGRDAHSARAYSFRDSYQAGEVLKHTLFGVGVVMAAKGAEKIEVLFESGAKTLVQGKRL